MLFWGCAGVVIAAELLIVHAAFTHPNAAPSAAEGSGIPQPARVTEVLWALVPIPVLGAVFWAAWRSLI